MKKNLALTTALAVSLPLSIFAQVPAPVAPPPPEPAISSVAPPAPPAPPAPVGRHLHEHESGPKKPVTFLGVETSSVPRVLSEQLGLPRGFGLVVDYVVPNSAAATAGVQPSDVIRMLNDQLIVEPDQLGKLVRNNAEGTEVTLTLLRKGQEMKVPVKLAKHDVAQGHGGPAFEQSWDFDDFGKMNFEAPDMTAVHAAVARAKAEAMRATDEARKAAGRLRVITTDAGTTNSTRVDLNNATVSFSDERGQLKLENVNGQKTLQASDAQGKLLFQGPINTEAERAKIPPDVRQRYEKLEKQEVPEVPEPPTPEDEPERPSSNQSALLQRSPGQQAGFLPNEQSGWRRSTFVL